MRTYALEMEDGGARGPEQVAALRKVDPEGITGQKSAEAKQAKERDDA